MPPLGTDHNSFIGSAAQYAVMKELLLLGCHVAIPEPDYGTDVFVLREDREDTARLQVKSAVLEPHTDGGTFSATFRIRRKQFDRGDNPKLYYVFAPRDESGFREFLVVPRKRLQELREAADPIKLTADGDDYKFRLQFRHRIRCGNVDLTEYRNAWDVLPPVRPSAPLSPDQPTAGTG